MSGETRSLDKFATPFGKTIELQNAEVEENVNLLRVRIKEGSRFTIVDLDPVTAKRWADEMLKWVNSQSN